MRSVERLIRQLANARMDTVRVELRTALKNVPDSHTLAEVPAPVRAAVLKLRKMRAEERVLTKVIEAAGYHTYHLDRDLSRTNSQNEKRTIESKSQNRIGKIEALRAEALIDTIGTTPEQAKQALVNFRAAILKV
jgi:hypothetical protein